MIPPVSRRNYTDCIPPQACGVRQAAQKARVFNTIFLHWNGEKLLKTY